MRFIKKTIPPTELTTWINIQKAAAISPNYGIFQNPEKRALKEYLIAEQKHICCYCEQEIKIDNKVVIEHQLPQSKFKHHELDYYNMHLSCTHDNKHCDTQKKDELIVNLLLHPECSKFFKYSPTGEILPNTHEYKNFEEFKENTNLLQFRFQSVVHLISVLELNSNQLVNERKKTFNDIISNKDALFNTKAKIEAYLVMQNAKKISIRFPSLVRYVLEKLLIKLN